MQNYDMSLLVFLKNIGISLNFKVHGTNRQISHFSPGNLRTDVGVCKDAKGITLSEASMTPEVPQLESKPEALPVANNMVKTEPSKVKAVTLSRRPTPPPIRIPPPPPPPPSRTPSPSPSQASARPAVRDVKPKQISKKVRVKENKFLNIEIN